MQIIEEGLYIDKNAKLWISLERYAKSIGKKEGTVKRNVNRGSGEYQGVEKSHIPNPSGRGRIVLYRLDSLCAEHQEAASPSPSKGGGLLMSSSKEGLKEGLIILPHQETLSEATSEYNAKLGRQMAMTAAWLLALCPQGVFDKAFKKRFEKYYEQYKQDYEEGLLYGQLIRNERSFSRRAKKYLNEGWRALVSKKLGQKKNWKVSPEVEHALMALAVNCFEYLPSSPKLLKAYEAFRLGEASLINKTTGEVLSGFGYPELSESCIYDWTQSPRFGLKNKLVLDKHFSSALEFRSQHEPFVWRKDPSFSLSKLTMDDKVLRFQFENGLSFWTYLVFDVHSGALVASASIEEKKEKLRTLKSTASDKVDKKGIKLILKAIQNLFKNLQDWGLEGYVPLEMESERHLAWSLRDTLLQPGNVFPYVRFCVGGNPQEKKAENFIRRFKYGVEMDYKGFKARPFARLLQNRLNRDKKHPTYTIKQGQDMLAEMIEKYNRLPHHKYKTKTKWQVFQEGLDTSKLRPLHYGNLARHIGSQARTDKINRSQYIQASGQTYYLPPASEWLEEIFGKSIEVYTLDFMPEKAWLWQGDTYICELHLRTEDMLESAAQAERGQDLGAGSERVINAKGQLFYEQKESFNKIIEGGLDEVRSFELQGSDEGGEVSEAASQKSDERSEILEYERYASRLAEANFQEDMAILNASNQKVEDEDDEEYIVAESDIDEDEEMRKRTLRFSYK